VREREREKQQKNIIVYIFYICGEVMWNMERKKATTTMRKRGKNAKVKAEK
jgi:hypothetical protein